MAYRIEGMDDLLKVFASQPRSVKKLSDTAMKDAVKAGVREMKRMAPARFKDLVKGKKGYDATRETWASIGYYQTNAFGGHQPKAYRGGEAKTGITDWFKFYWNDYGTLTLRDPSHKFVKPVRGKNERRRNNIGIKHRNYFDRSLPTTTQKFQEAYEASVEKHKDILLEK